MTTICPACERWNRDKPRFSWIEPGLPLLTVSAERFEELERLLGKAA
ncbi:MAG: hypothetical protein ACRD3Q_18545 [Terriglobales bacterium]